MKKTYFFIPMVLVIILTYFGKLGNINLRSMESIDLSTLLFVFPIILALTERFNQLFIVKKKPEDATEAALKVIKETNFRWSIMASFTIGLLLAVAGFRILEVFIEPPKSTLLFENTLFRSLDCILTGAVIGGGAEGWHQLVKLFSDLTKAKRKEIQQNQQP